MFSDPYLRELEEERAVLIARSAKDDTVEGRTALGELEMRIREYKEAMRS